LVQRSLKARGGSEAEEAAAAEASRKAAEEAAAAAAESKNPAEASTDYSFKAAENIAEIPEEVESSYALLVNVDNGTVVAGRDYDTQMNPASMTKILTLLVAVENIDLSRLDTDTEEITQEIANYVWQNQMSQVGWQIGDTPTIRSLLYGTILPSGADAAQALAIYTACSEEAFVELMNKKLADLGISDTAHFTNVVGAYDEDHYCTALDMATILRAAIDNELCREVLSCHYYEVPPSGGEDSQAIGISNWFLRRIEDKDTHGEVVCAKTGYTGEAGFCCASYQEADDGGRYICVTADGAGIWLCIYDHVEIFTAFM
jgi:D-alanyl-D-alanine carboxypeptidase (penicillin-binding protein 5/6)